MEIMDVLISTPPPGSVEDRGRQAISHSRLSLVEDYVRGDFDKISFDLVAQAALETEPLDLNAMKTLSY